MAQNRRLAGPRRAQSRRKRAESKPAGLPAGIGTQELLARLAEVARIGALFIEGEDVIDALRPEARAWTEGDDVNFDPAVTVPLKKTLLRIERIESFQYYAILWRRRPDDPGKVEVALCGGMGSTFAAGPRSGVPIFPALRQVFDRGKPATVAVNNPKLDSKGFFHYGHVWIVRNDSLLRAGRRLISHFHPIRDSREDVVAALELACVGTDH